MNEKKERSIKNREIYRRILRLIQPYRHLLILSLIFAVVSVVLTLYAPVLTGRGRLSAACKGYCLSGSVLPPVPEAVRFSGAPSNLSRLIS